MLAAVPAEWRAGTLAARCQMPASPIVAGLATIERLRPRGFVEPKEPPGAVAVAATRLSLRRECGCERRMVAKRRLCSMWAASSKLPELVFLRSLTLAASEMVATLGGMHAVIVFCDLQTVVAAASLQRSWFGAKRANAWTCGRSINHPRIVEPSIWRGAAIAAAVVDRLGWGDRDRAGCGAARDEYSVWISP